MTGNVFLAKLSHESNTFSEMTTGHDAFRHDEAIFGEEISEYFRGTETVVGGALEVLNGAGIDLVQSVAASANPGGVVEREAYDYYFDYVVDSVREHEESIDGVLLVLHGAMVPEGRDDGEGPLISAVRDVVGETVPIIVTLDLHGNVTREMVAGADAIVAYETHPHLDMFETGERATEILVDDMEGEIDPVMAVERPPVLPHSPRQNTFDGPMADIVERARSIEERQDIVKVNVLPGFHRADVPEMGFTIPVVADGEEEAAREAARELAALVWEMREEFVDDYSKPTEAVARAKELAADLDGDDGPIVMADMGPQPGGGGSADGTPVLRAILDQGLEDVGYAIMLDPEVVRASVDAGVGERLSVTMGGKADDVHGDPIEDLTGHVKLVSDGEYVNTGTSHTGTGTVNHLGRTVRFQCGENGSVDVIVTEQRGLPFDAEVFRHVGIIPERLNAVVVTSTTAFRGDYGGMASEIIEIDSPGLSSPIPERFDYEKLRRPKFPIDDMSGDDYPNWT